MTYILCWCSTISII